MDPFAPISGISLERYADLCAAMKDTGGDRAQCGTIAQQHGFRQEDWFAAQEGWTARMADPALMGKVALAYMPLYQAALAKTGPAATATYREYVSMMAAIGTFGPEGMYARCGVSGVEWSQIATYWSNQLTAHQAEYPTYGDDLIAEKKRLADGSAPLRRGQDVDGARPDAGNLAAAAQAIVDLRFRPGDEVRVQWSDGQKYGGQIMDSKDGQVLVRWPNGQSQWIPQNAVEKA